jgi:hypothetical protein
MPIFALAPAARATSASAKLRVPSAEARSTPSDDGTLQALPPYGIAPPPPDDAGQDARDQGDAGDASDGALQSQPPYGIAPPPPEDAGTDADASLRDADADGELMSEDAYGAVALPDASNDH